MIDVTKYDSALTIARKVDVMLNHSVAEVMEDVCNSTTDRQSKLKAYKIIMERWGSNV